jgi:hypothetical protein
MLLQPHDCVKNDRQRTWAGPPLSLADDDASLP